MVGTYILNEFASVFDLFNFVDNLIYSVRDKKNIREDFKQIEKLINYCET